MGSIHFFDKDTKSSLRRFNFMNPVMLYALGLERIRLHQQFRFPYNILLLVKEDTLPRKSYIECRLEKKTFSLEAGNFYFIPTGHEAYYYLEPDIRYYTFHVGMEILSGVDLYSTAEHCVSGDASAMLSAIGDAWNDPLPPRQICRIRSMLLDFFLAHWPEQHPFSEKSASPAWKELLEYVQQNCDARMTIAELAERQKISPEAFSRKFHAAFGMTPKLFLTNLLIKKVAALLTQPSMSVKEAAAHLHFSSEFYLSRFLRKHTGLSPTLFRQNFLWKPSAGGVAPDHKSEG